MESCQDHGYFWKRGSIEEQMKANKKIRKILEMEKEVIESIQWILKNQETGKKVVYEC